MARIDAFLEIARQQGGSDLHLVVGKPPLVRLDGVARKPLWQSPRSRVPLLEWLNSPEDIREKDVPIGVAPQIG